VLRLYERQRELDQTYMKQIRALLTEEQARKVPGLSRL
jgi:hypothetical protein